MYLGDHEIIDLGLLGFLCFCALYINYYLTQLNLSTNKNRKSHIWKVISLFVFEEGIRSTQICVQEVAYTRNKFNEHKINIP